jgi:dCMP deaminase
MTFKNKREIKTIATHKTQHSRPSWDEYFLEIMEKIGDRATCDRGRSGCVIVRNKRIMSTGYVGAPAGCAHCDDVGHEMQTVINEDGTQSRHCIRTTHTELNAIIQAARFGVSTEDCVMYCNMTPCYTCAKAIINAGIKRVVAKYDYHAGKRSKEVFKEAGVQFDLINKKEESYSDK